MAEHLELGRDGEDFVVKHLVKLQFDILDRNYRKKWGEVDVIAEKDNILHFIEVKTVSCETDFRDNGPEENVHYFKKKRLSRAIQTYLAEKKVPHETEFQIDVAAVYLNQETGENKIRITKNIIL